MGDNSDFMQVIVQLTCPKHLITLCPMHVKCPGKAEAFNIIDKKFVHFTRLHVEDCTNSMYKAGRKKITAGCCSLGLL